MRANEYAQDRYIWQRKAAELDSVSCAVYESEDLLQNACYLWYNHFLRERGELFAIPNGGSRHKAEALKFVATGTKAGVADMELLIPFGRAVFIELKNRKNYLDDKQEAFRIRIENIGFEYYMINTFHQFACLIQFLYQIPDQDFDKLIY